MERLPLSRPVRVQPFTGLTIDVDTWATAHDYHRRHHQLHLLSLHGSGIAQGLSVLPTDPPSDAVVVEPGVAIDQAGNVIVVPDNQRVTLGPGKGTSYIVLDYVESLPPSTDATYDSRGRLIEDFRLRVLPALPDSPALELSRIQMSQSANIAVVGPANPWSPGPNEIDTRFRFRFHPQAPEEVSIGLVICGAAEDLDPQHLRGFHHFLRELDYCGHRSILLTTEGNDVPKADLLYVTGAGTAQPSTGLAKGISDQVKKGAWLLADVCGPGSQFTDALRAVAGQGRKAGSETEGRVLGAHFVFGDAPAGTSGAAEILWGERAIISARDFGCAWAGRHGKKAFPREDIRSALEFAVNVAICASKAAPPP